MRRELEHAWRREHVLPDSRRLVVFPHEAELLSMDLPTSLDDLAAPDVAIDAGWFFERPRNDSPTPRQRLALPLSARLVLGATVERALHEAGWFSEESGFTRGTPGDALNPIDWTPDFDAQERIRRSLLSASARSHPWLVVLDFAQYSRTLSHSRIVDAFAERGVPESTRRDVSRVLGKIVGAERGVPEAITSSHPLYCFALAGYDDALRKKGATVYAFVDDAFALCASRQMADEVLDMAHHWATDHGLAINEKKSFVLSTRDVQTTHLGGLVTPLHRQTTRRRERIVQARRLAGGLLKRATLAAAASKPLADVAARRLEDRLRGAPWEAEYVFEYLRTARRPALAAAVGEAIVAMSDVTRERWLMAAMAVHRDATSLRPETEARLVAVLEGDAPIPARAFARAILGRLAPRHHELVARDFDAARQNMLDADLVVSLARAPRTFTSSLLDRAGPLSTFVARARQKLAST